MSYVTITVIVDGALESEDDFTDYALAEEWIREVARDAENDGVLTEVYLLRHEHDPFEDGDCSCIQYITDHHPAYVFPLDAPESFRWQGPKPERVPPQVNEHPLAP